MFPARISKGVAYQHGNDTSRSGYSGGAVFIGTRVPLRNLIDYLEGGFTLDEFLDSFPSVSRELAVFTLEAAHEALTACAHAA